MPRIEYDPADIEHVTRLAAALGFTDVVFFRGCVVPGDPSTVANGCRASYGGKRYEFRAPPCLGTHEARRLLAVELHGWMLSMVASEEIRPTTGAPSAGIFHTVSA